MLNQSRSEQDHKNLLEQGFTLIELLIVIVILGILAGIVVFGVSNLTSDASKNACAAETSTVRSAAEAFKAKAARYPQSMNELQTDTTVGTVTVQALLKSAPKNYQADVSGGWNANKFTVTFDTTAPVGETLAITPNPDNSCTS